MLILGVICFFVGAVTFLLNALIGPDEDHLLRPLSITMLVLGTVMCLAVAFGLVS